MRNMALGSALVLALACGDSGNETTAGAGAATGGTDAAGTNAAGSGAGAGATTGGTMAPVGTTGGTGADVSGGSGGDAASGAGGAGGAASGAGGAGAGGTGDAGGAGVDAGGTGGDGGAGGMGATVCSAPEPAASPGNACPSGDPPTLTTGMVGDTFDAPVFVTHAPGDTARLFVVERPGRILIIDRDGSNERTFLDISSMVTSGTGSAETGLLGLAFHPDFPTDPRFFVNYTASGAAGLTTRIATYEVSASDDEQVMMGDESTLFDFSQPQPNHNGGMLAFGHDGCLYLGTGDGGGSNDMHSMPCADGNGQCLDTPLGKILRIDVDAPDMAAPGNLDGGHRHIWDYGIRNAWRFSFDRETGDLYIGDVGQDAVEEVDVAPRGVGHFNWGWRIAEGSSCRGGGGGCDMTGLEPPTDEYDNTGPDDCVIGGYVYRGAAIPDLQGWYLYGDNGSNRIHAFVWDGDGRCGDDTIELTDQLPISGDLTSFGEDGDGELYMTTLTGNLYRIEAE